MESGEYENTYKPLSGREMAILAIFIFTRSKDVTTLGGFA